MLNQDEELVATVFNRKCIALRLCVRCKKRLKRKASEAESEGGGEQKSQEERRREKEKELREQ